MEVRSVTSGLTCVRDVCLPHPPFPHGQVLKSQGRTQALEETDP